MSHTPAPAPPAADLRAAIAHAVARRDFTAEEMAALVGAIMDGDGDGATAAQVAALLVALRMKGETVAELRGAAQAMRARATPLRVPEGPLVDTCGTGGDGAGTINVSTLAALVVAACGVRVAKHGNRALSSRAGSADVLQALGVNVAATPAQVERCLAEAGLGFLFAPAFHGATQRAAAVRREIGVRTMFNLLGPLTNPAGVRRQVVGVYGAELCLPLCQVLAQLGAEHVLVVHGRLPGPDGAVMGLDEIAPAGETVVAEWDQRRGEGPRQYTLSPADFGLRPAAEIASLMGGDPEHNAARARALLRADEAERAAAAYQAVVMTAGSALYVAGAAPDLRAGAGMADEALRRGRAEQVLRDLVRISHG